MGVTVVAVLAGHVERSGVGVSRLEKSVGHAGRVGIGSGVGWGLSATAASDGDGETSSERPEEFGPLQRIDTGKAVSG